MSVMLAVGGHEWLKSALTAEGFDATLFTVSRTRIPGLKRFQTLSNKVGFAARASSAAHEREAVLVCLDLRTCMIAGLFGLISASRRVPMVALNMIVHPKSGIGGFARDRVYRAICRRAPMWVSVNSEWLRQSYLDAYDFSPERVQVLSDCWLPDWLGHLVAPSEADGGYVFSGGRAARDWRTVVDAARACPEIPFRVIAQRADWPKLLDDPDNLEVYFDTSVDFFWETARNARIAIVSVATKVTSGLIVLILTALMGRPVVSTQTPAIELYYPAECSELLVEPGDHSEMARCVKSLWADSVHRLACAKAMQNYIVATRSPEAYTRRLAEIIRSTTL
jgi:hypothetical protein